VTLWLHDPDSVLDYTWDFEGWLNGDTITTATLTPTTGLTINSSNTGPTAVTAWLSTDGTTGTREVTCSITTAAGRSVDRTATIHVQQR